MVPDVPEADRDNESARRLAAPGRVLLAAGLWTAAGLVIARASAAQAAEAWLAARLAGFYAPGHAAAAGEVIFAGLGTPSPVGLRITGECTVVILVVPMLVVAGILSLSGRFALHGILVGLAAGLGTDIVSNQARIGLITWATSRYGMGTSYEVTHELIGSLIAMSGFTVALVLMIRSLTRSPGSPAGRSESN